MTERTKLRHLIDSSMQKLGIILPESRATSKKFLLPTIARPLASPQPVPIPAGVLQPTFCSAVMNGAPTSNPVAIGLVASQIVAFERRYQAASPVDVSAPNPTYIGTLLQQGLSTGAANMFDPNFQTPRSVETNI